MAVSVGLDLVDVASVDAAIDAHGDRYLNRIYTEGERNDCQRNPRLLATRFAAKEAAIKVLGEEALPWRCIEVVRPQGGRMRLVLHGRALEMARQRGIEQLSVSIGSTRRSATAIVIGATA